MKPRREHLTDIELTLTLDGEWSSAHERDAASGHLAQCWRCRARMEELSGSVAGYMRLHESTAATTGDGRGPAARLRAQLATHGARPLAMSSFAIPAIVLCLAGAAAIFWMIPRRDAATPGGGPLPDARLTPGATRLISREQVCAVTTEEEGRRIPLGIAQQVFARYEIREPKPRAYEVDYLISPELGGAEDVRNLWPQPYDGGPWTSRVKDALEDYLREQVCTGRLDLAEAQTAIAHDWIAAYRKYFRVTAPIAAHALFVKDPPWE